MFFQQDGVRTDFESRFRAFRIFGKTMPVEQGMEEGTVFVEKFRSENRFVFILEFFDEFRDMFG